MSRREQVITEVRRAFGGIPRPEPFIRGTCWCEECTDHDQEMRAFPPDDLPLEQLDNPGWDPICFASDQAFAYLMPGMVRLALEHTFDYIDQFLFHLGLPERVAVLTPDQLNALIGVLELLVEESPEALQRNLAEDDLLQVWEGLERALQASRSR